MFACEFCGRSCVLVLWVVNVNLLNVCFVFSRYVLASHLLFVIIQDFAMPPRLRVPAKGSGVKRAKGKDNATHTITIPSHSSQCCVSWWCQVL